MDIYFVDCENVGLNHIKPDKEKYKIYYFVSNGQTITLDENEEIIECSHNKCKDALDFLIDTFIGYKLKECGTYHTYHIISSDTGFNNIINFWREYGYTIYRTTYEKVIIPIDIEKEEIIENKIIPLETNDMYIEHNVIEMFKTFDRNEKRKLQNIYMDWFKSKSRDRIIIYKNLKRTYSYLDNVTINEIIKYLTTYKGQFNIYDIA